jgi:hypothetical protein
MVFLACRSGDLSVIVNPSSAEGSAVTSVDVRVHNTMSIVNDAHQPIGNQCAS